MTIEKIWENRLKLINGSTKDTIEKWVSNNKHNYSTIIFIDEHPKDGWVAYLKRDME